MAPILKTAALLTAWAAQALATVTTISPPISNVYTFGPNVFVESIAVRYNGNLLLTSPSTPNLYSVNPKVATPSASVVHAFTDGTTPYGIAEVSHDKFAVVTAEWDLMTTRAILGTLKVWTVNFNTATPSVNLVANVANTTIFNGIVRHPTNPHLLLAADSAIGAVWKINLVTGAYGIAFESPLLAPTATAHLGINGIKAKGEYVYFTNSAQGYYGKVKINYHGAAVGPITTISTSAAAGADVVYDDLAFDPTGRCKAAWIASHPDYAIGVFPNGDQLVIKDSEKLLNPTAAAFGRGSLKQSKTLYITNGGRFLPDFTLVDEGVVAIDLSQTWPC